MPSAIDSATIQRHWMSRIQSGVKAWHWEAPRQGDGVMRVHVSVGPVRGSNRKSFRSTPFIVILHAIKALNTYSMGSTHSKPAAVTQRIWLKDGFQGPGYYMIDAKTDTIISNVIPHYRDFLDGLYGFGFYNVDPNTGKPFGKPCIPVQKDKDGYPLPLNWELWHCNRRFPECGGTGAGCTVNYSSGTGYAVAGALIAASYGGGGGGGTAEAAVELARNTDPGLKTLKGIE